MWLFFLPLKWKIYLYYAIMDVIILEVVHERIDSFL